jgi:Skp family chaperone for outer membrane proteins
MMTIRYRGGRIMTRLRLLLLLALACASAPAALAQTPAPKAAPDNENGRYSMSPVADGVLRLDTRTGQVSLCRQKSDSWVCEATADDRAAYEKEIARLQAKVASLEAELKRQPGGELKLPSDAEVDRVMKFFETVFRRFIGMIEGLQRENEQKRS